MVAFYGSSHFFSSILPTSRNTFHTIRRNPIHENKQALNTSKGLKLNYTNSFLITSRFNKSYNDRNPTLRKRISIKELTLILTAERPSPQFLGGAEQAQKIFSRQEELNLFLTRKENLRDPEAPRKPVKRGTLEFTVETTVLDISEIWDAKDGILKQTQIVLEGENTEIDDFFERFD